MKNNNKGIKKDKSIYGSDVCLYSYKESEQIASMKKMKRKENPLNWLASEENKCMAYKNCERLVIQNNTTRVIKTANF